MSKKLILLLLAVTIGSPLFVLAQQAPVAIMKFKEKEKDFGTFKEEIGSVTYSFKFKNVGKKPVIIRNVYSTCGCTVPDWSKQPIAPGKEGYVKATYNAKNRPGPFSKNVTVIANTVPAKIILRIKGKVTPRVKTIADLYPTKINGLRLKSRHISFANVKNTEVKKTQLPVYNDSDAPITISYKNLPKYLVLKMVPNTLKPKQKGVIWGEYNGPKKNDWGYVYDYVNFLINDKEERKQRLTVSANIVENFDNLTPEQRANAPKIEIDENVFNFKEIKQGDKVAHTFKIKNIGKSNLIIRKTKASCGCTAIAPQSKIIAPGQTSDLKIIFSSRGKRGPQNKSITVTTNDPVTPSVYMRITGKVIVPKK